MKKSAILIATVGLALGSVHAQTVPLFINYQGKVTGGNDVPLGSTGAAPNFTAAPINRKMIFRIFDAQTGGTRLWSEQQTVTVSLGEFSVLLGQGTDAVYESVTESRPALDTVFTGGGAVPPSGPVRFPELVVDDGNGTFTAAADLPISPRQRLTSTSYSFRARVADTVPNLAIGTPALADGSVTALKIGDNQISTVKIADGAIQNADLADSLVNSTKIADGSIATADLANASVTAAKLDAGIGVWTAAGGNVSRLTGNVGIGKQPAVALDVAGAIAATGAVNAASLTSTGAVTGGSISTAGALTAGSINTTGPFAATTITANDGVRIPGNDVLELGAGIAGKEGSAGKIGYQVFSDAVDIVGAGPTGTTRKIKMWAEGGTVFTGRVGIGTVSPAVQLDVVGTNSITMVDNGYQSSVLSSGTIGGILTYSATSSDSVNGAGIELYGMSGGGNLPNDANFIAPVSIRSDGWIASGKGITVYSDRRIKRDLHASVTASDLAAIQQLQVTDYRMVDPADGGMAWRKGFIAQEVEKVIPSAVTRSVEFVPDIFSVATAVLFNPGAQTLTVTLTKDHGLKAGERVRLHVDGSRLDLDVSAVPSAREFVVEKCERAPEKVLVYGRQVKDFRTVDCDRIFTTGVGALQELKKEKDAEVKALQEENASLRNRLAAVEANDKARDARLAGIEKLILSAEKPVVRTVSLKSGK